jgi:hypothetical protein
MRLTTWQDPARQASVSTHCVNLTRVALNLQSPKRDAGGEFAKEAQETVVNPINVGRRFAIFRGAFSISAATNLDRSRSIT